MARIFITGSAAGLGQFTGQSLISKGHEVVLHARNEARGKEALNATPGAKAVLLADLCEPEATKRLAAEVNGMGPFDVVIHNAGVYQAPAAQLLAVNTLAPYILTSLIKMPRRLIYLSSGMHLGGHANSSDIKNNINRISYSDTKLHVLMLCKAVARKWPAVYANAVDPGWVPTKMGGAGAPDDLQKGFETQVWLADGKGKEANVSGKYFFHREEQSYHTGADDLQLQEHFLEVCREVTGISFPDR
ncbi:SDR family NAD(P)-dependent oxidoreductase [uncultured Chitinophaga sp.]|uniref:SDR family NAD(P)-dependent oxidoreductase n=1 Tax=uncultured Chitinophaga sp. TaxID=339340 RepID=UPI0025F449A9|nr:SDR family NAD(P)-dependent oxidoreductase [uncultured Chitinophaga sp.]